MRPSLLIAFLLIFIGGYSQTATLPSWFTESYKSKGLDKKYSLNLFLKPSFLQADFNGDSMQDIAVLVISKATKKKGVLLMHGKTNDYFLFGAGTRFGSGEDNYDWADKWSLYTKKNAEETKFDENGDILGSKKVKLARPGILIEALEDGELFADYLFNCTTGIDRLKLFIRY